MKLCFAWDDSKNRSNQRKHGRIAFEMAAQVFRDPFRVRLRPRHHGADRAADALNPSLARASFLGDCARARDEGCQRGGHSRKWFVSTKPKKRTPQTIGQAAKTVLGTAAGNRLECPKRRD